MKQRQTEVKNFVLFRFVENWSKFLENLSDGHIMGAESVIKNSAGVRFI